MRRTEASIEVDRSPEAVFEQLLSVPDWHRWHWDWKWTQVESDGDGGVGTVYRSTLEVQVSDQGSDFFSVAVAALDAAAAAADAASAATGGSSAPDADIGGESGQGTYHTDTYRPNLAVVEDLEAPHRVAFSLPWDVVDVRETYTLESTPSGCRLTCMEERGDPFFSSHLPHISIPGSRKRTIHAGLKRLRELLA